MTQGKSHTPTPLPHMWLWSLFFLEKAVNGSTWTENRKNIVFNIDLMFLPESL